MGSIPPVQKGTSNQSIFNQQQVKNDCNKRDQKFNALPTELCMPEHTIGFEPMTSRLTVEVTDLYNKSNIQ
ncbi:hypothetical protein UFOVP816_43 [uncultured Caudovirales phage]|uniref:Uncharacterized protein n=1 Tax=uncultured Caudovirales phage TaxID=2100421 RepID=A0A6J5NZP3_9CAUD|nr:hypothetical protein UFOVP816_43 [uncultured Caudovirales phage]